MQIFSKLKTNSKIQKTPLGGEIATGNSGLSRFSIKVNGVDDSVIAGEHYKYSSGPNVYRGGMIVPVKNKAEAYINGTTRNVNFTKKELIVSVWPGDRNGNPHNISDELASNVTLTKLDSKTYSIVTYNPWTHKNIDVSKIQSIVDTINNNHNLHSTAFKANKWLIVVINESTPISELEEIIKPLLGV